ncbi:hypothetical protein [Flammeovirga sp. SJP92]|uniref:hypothetical protein n=1 Tax=Flammeovirga sp. SJP92 TaxID=1775430 RepID=UPI0012FA321F|nr:hypothetical protein [Flammeovirga sp. SJP92]
MESLIIYSIFLMFAFQSDKSLEIKTLFTDKEMNKVDITEKNRSIIIKDSKESNHLIELEIINNKLDKNQLRRFLMSCDSVNVTLINSKKNIYIDSVSSEMLLSFSKEDFSWEFSVSLRPIIYNEYYYKNNIKQVNELVFAHPKYVEISVFKEIH